MQLRPYQSECIATVNDYLASTDDHGVVSLPTGAGKTVIFATMIREWLMQWPDTRVCILAHRQELLSQAESKLKAVWPAAPVGVWSAGLGRREGRRNILIAGIQSVYKRACDFDPFEIIIVDEAHLTPNTSDTMYRKFLEDARLNNPRVRIVGFTATPYRLDGGDLCGEGKLFSHIIYEAPIRTMIDDGYLCNLRTKATDTKLDASGLKVRQGEYIAGDMEDKFNTASLVEAAVSEIVTKGGDRKAWLIFCCGVAHAEHVSSVFATHGIAAPVITGETPKDERARILASFDVGQVRAVVNVNCLTTGLDVTRIDLIAVMRCTLSTSLWVQMVGRGFRLHDGKSDCLILDMGENAMRHGPLDNLKIKTKGGGGDGPAPAKVCPECQEYVHAASLVCPCCGFEFPAREIKHATKASEAPILTEVVPWDMPVVDVFVGKHQKEGKPPSICVTYSDGSFNSHREWICIEHEGYARAKARGWWRKMFNEEPPATVDEAINGMFGASLLATKLQNRVESIRVRKSGKYTEIINHGLRNGHGSEGLQAVTS